MNYMYIQYYIQWLNSHQGACIFTHHDVFALYCILWTLLYTLLIQLYKQFIPKLTYKGGGGGGRNSRPPPKWNPANAVTSTYAYITFTCVFTLHMYTIIISCTLHAYLLYQSLREYLYCISCSWLAFHSRLSSCCQGWGEDGWAWPIPLVKRTPLYNVHRPLW